MSSYDRRAFLGATGTLATLVVPVIPSSTSPPAKADEPSTPSELIREIVRRMEERAAWWVRECAADPELDDMAWKLSSERNMTGLCSNFVSLEVTLLLDIIDERLDLTKQEKLEVWGAIERMAVNRRLRVDVLRQRRERKRVQEAGVGT